MFQHRTGHEQLTERILKCAFEVHSVLGAGLLESVYATCLATELSDANLAFVEQHRVPIIYKGRRLDKSLTVDFIIEGVVLVEVKALETIAPVHVAQTITYLKLTSCPIGLLLNFNTPSLRNGIRRLHHPSTRAATPETGESAGERSSDRKSR